MTQYHFDPATYVANMRKDIPDFDAFQDRVAQATRGVDARRILDLGVGTGETARRVLALHPRAELVGIDASAAMVATARETVSATLHVSRLQDPLPPAPFDLVVAALSVHHLDPDEKRSLFRRVAQALRPGGRFVLGDVVVPDHPEEARIPLSREFDLPDRVHDQLEWLRRAGLSAFVLWIERDLAIMSADRHG